jgi:hypothetical protein
VFRFPAPEMFKLFKPFKDTVGKSRALGAGQRYWGLASP